MHYSRKIISYLYISLIMILLVSCDSTSKDQSNEKMIESGKELSMFVTTDIHYLTKELNDQGVAFEKYFAKGDGKLLQYSEEIVDAFAYDIESKRPDILIISGDLTNNGEEKSHLNLAKKLKQIEKSSETRIYVIPGNHDIQNPWARGFKDEEQYVTDSISSDEFVKIYQEYGYDEAISRDSNSLSYLAAPAKDVWLLMLDTNVYKTNYKYGSPATYGQLSDVTYEWIRECSDLAKQNNAQIITVMHHNLVNHNMHLNYGFTLDDNEKAVNLFRECSINLVLSGHIHMQDIKLREVETTQIYDVVTSALSVYPIQYGVIKYLPTKGFEYKTSQVDVEGWAKQMGSSDDNLKHFQTYSENFFGNNSYDMVSKNLTDLDIYTDEEKKEMAEMMRLLNLNYFAGTISSVRDEIKAMKGYKLWQSASEPEFLVQYVISMIYDDKINNNELYIPVKQ